MVIAIGPIVDSVVVYSIFLRNRGSLGFNSGCCANLAMAIVPQVPHASNKGVALSSAATYLAPHPI